MVSIVTTALAALAMLASIATGEMQAHGHIRGGDSMALVLSENTQEEVADDSCDASNGQGCQRQLMMKLDEGRQDAPPEFVPTNEWQDILPNQAIPPGLYIRVNLETGKKEAKLLEMQHGSLQQRVGLIASTPLLTAARVRANFDEQASGGKTTLIPVWRKYSTVLANSQPTSAAGPPMFEPSHEWKEILPNQVLPAGLHIRVNLQTGKKEAKLID